MEVRAGVATFVFVCIIGSGSVRPDPPKASRRAGFFVPKPAPSGFFFGVNMTYKIIRAPALLERLCLKKSAVYSMMAAGTLPPPIKLTSKAVAWVDGEIDAVVAARVAGLHDDEIRALVARLVADRSKVHPVAVA